MYRMKSTVLFVTLLCISASWAAQKNAEEAKEKREAALSYQSPGHSSHSYQTPSLGQEDASAVSIGAGYSVGGGKPQYSFGAHGAGAALQIPSQDLPASGHATIQLAPITLQPTHGGLASNDLSQLMSQIQHGLNSGAFALQSPNGLGGLYQYGGQGLQSYGGQELSLPQFSFSSPKFQQYSLAEQQPQASGPAYAAGTKGLSSYSSTGPVLFNPSDSHAGQPALNLAAYSGQSYGDLGAGVLSLGGSGHSLGSSGLSPGGSGYSIGGPGHALGGSGQYLSGSGHSLGGSGHSLSGFGNSHGVSGHLLAGSGHSLGSSGNSLGGSGHSLGGSGHSQGGHSLGGLSLSGSGNSFGSPYKSQGGSYLTSGKGSFKPSTYIGSSAQSESSHGLSGLTGSPSFGGSHSYPGSFGGSSSFSGGPAKHFALSYTPSKLEGFGSSLEGVAGFSTDGHLSLSPGSSFGSSGSFGGAAASHAASSHTPQYYAASSKHSSPSFGEGSSSYRGAPSGHSSLSSFSSSPRYSFSGHSGPSARYSSPNDSHGAYSESSYNTIKYSAELKPNNH